MSGFLPDLANWALRGGAASEEEGGAAPPLSPEEIRAQRLARMEQAQQAQQPQEEERSSTNHRNTAVKEEQPQPMEVETEETSVLPEEVSATEHNTNKKKKAKPNTVGMNDNKKLQRKKELILKKTLSIVLSTTPQEDESSNNHNNNNSLLYTYNTDPETTLSTNTLALILATRLAAFAPNHNVLSYLADSHRKASEELKTITQLQQSSSSKTKDTVTPKVLELLQEIQRQTVSYAASCLLEPDLFPASHDSIPQLLHCLQSSSSSPEHLPITFGVHGTSSSFYYLLVEEIIEQDGGPQTPQLQTIVADCLQSLLPQLARFHPPSIVDSASLPAVLTALQSLCVHKRVAHMITQLPSFLLPPAGSPEAAREVRPSVVDSSGVHSFWQLLSGEQAPPYRQRSGPALEKHTLLGLVLKMGIPMRNNAAFPPASVLRQSPSQVSSIMRSQRAQLKAHQEACYQLIMSLIKGGPAARSRVMQWFTDALVVNVAASGMRPDPSKVSSSSLMLNLSAILLRLCEPFLQDPQKHKLIDVGFVSSPADHGGVFPSSGDDAVARLGGETDPDDAETTMMAVEEDAHHHYNPKNSFIPQCFFLCARSLHLGILPLLSTNYNMLAQISRMHHDLTASNQNLESNQRFQTIISFQRSFEVPLFQEEPLTDSLRFCNLMAKVLCTLEDDQLKSIPEDFVSDSCDIFTKVARQKGKALAGLDASFVFKLCVKLLSPKYSGMVRNYNLRAKLGDALYEIFLPTEEGGRRDIPPNVFCDPASGGQPFLLADKDARETLAPSLLLLYGEVEQTGYYDKMSHRANICNILKYLWDHQEHRQAFRRITGNKESFITFANGIMNETNSLISTVMQKLPEIREIQLRMRNAVEWGQLNEEQQNEVSERLESAEREVKSALPLCNKTLQMFSYLNTDPDIRKLFLLDELISRLVQMLLHVMTKLVGSKGLDLKVENPEQYEFRPKEMLRDLCAVCALFTPFDTFQVECAKAAWDPSLLETAVKTCKRLVLLTGESMQVFESLPGLVKVASASIEADESLLADAPDEFLDEVMATFMKDPVLLPSGHVVDRSTISQHLLNDPTDPFTREPLSMDKIQPATELKERMQKWVEEKRAAEHSRNASKRSS